ncbi:RteC domain-containing protein [Maribacter sp. SA7]|uniref:RteC domain-containing protein n=1 Tax=Maribacter zhoushanensis TaxID=3030012 RepID=UPI0023EBA23A|nr:RteC domain-containing protein [Maribacter zhoushanensis]MDF4203840.1 RteC domain-containing protein [Maribacter zhoushanensis]
MLYFKIIDEFHEHLKEIKIGTSALLDESNLTIALCAKTLGKLSRYVDEYGFESTKSEIEFFKTIKVIPMQYLIYYIEVRSCELRMPKIGRVSKLEFLQKQTEKINSFFAKHTEFLIYLDSNYEYLDKNYFTRKHLDKSPLVKSYPYYKDPKFNTSHGEILARLRGLGMFTNYLNEKIKKFGLLDTKDINNAVLNWTGSYSSFVELIYGCEAMGYFNNGNITITEIIEVLGDFLSIKRGNPSRTYNEIKNRKNSRIKFFNEAGQKLLNKMDKEDGV